MITTLNEFRIFESNNEVKKLQKELKRLEDTELNKLRSVGKIGSTEWDKLVDEIKVIRRKLYDLTGDSYGINKKDKKKIKPNGVESKYNYPQEVPKDVYRWLKNNSNLLTDDATDAVRWYRIINTKNNVRYPSGDMEIFRAVDKRSYDDIRPGDWVTTERKYAIEHNNRWFDGKGKIISDIVDGRDILVSPTGDKEEAIYAPLKYSIDIKI